MLAKYRLTFIGFGAAVVTFLGGWIFQFNLTERVVLFWQSHDISARLGMNELLLPLLILGVFALFDQRRRRRLQQFKQEKVQLSRAMLASTHHILNNFLNQLQMFRLTAEETPGFPASELILFDQIIKETVRQVRNLETVARPDGESISATAVPHPAVPKTGKKTLRGVVASFLI